MRSKLIADSVVALKSGDSKKSQALRYLVSLIDKENSRSVNQEISESGEIKILQKELKNKQESLEVFSKAGRGDLAAEVEQEIVILKNYLPEMMTEDQVKVIVLEVISSGEKNFGMIMKSVGAKVAGRADGSLIAKIVKENL